MKHPSLLLVTFVTLASTASAGCGTAGDDLFGGGTEAAASGAGGTSSATSSSGPSDTSATAQASTSGPGPTSTSAQASSAAASTAASTGSGPSSMLDCGGQSCPQTNQGGCCWDHYGLNGEPQGDCVQGGMDCDTEFHDAGPTGGETLIQCETPDQCPGQVCCGKRQYSFLGSYYTAVLCQLSCTWPDVTLCDATDPSFACPVVLDQQTQTQTQTICQPSTLLPPSYNVCGLP